MTKTQAALVNPWRIEALRKQQEAKIPAQIWVGRISEERMQIDGQPPKEDYPYAKPAYSYD
jgi:hypothetical protein